MYSKKVQIVQYDPVTVSFGGSVQLEEGDDASEEYHKLLTRLRSLVYKELLTDFENHGVDPEDYFEKNRH